MSALPSTSIETMPLPLSSSKVYTYYSKRRVLCTRMIAALAHFSHSRREKRSHLLRIDLQVQCLCSTGVPVALFGKPQGGGGTRPISTSLFHLRHLDLMSPRRVLIIQNRTGSRSWETGRQPLRPNMQVAVRDDLQRLQVF